MIESDTTPDAPSGQATGYYPGGIGTYTKYLDVPEDAKDKRILVEFDGAYMNTVVMLNGHKVTTHAYGYTPFHADLTPYIKPGQQNRLAVTVNNSAQPNSRWYTGSGLYRNVELLTGPKKHISPWGIFAHTSHIVNGTAFVVVETTIENHTAEDASLWVNLTAEKVSTGEAGGYGKAHLYVPAGSTRTARVQIAIEEAALWDIDSPHLYKITAQLFEQDTLLDEEAVNFGIRTISVDVKNGFMLNGRTIKLQGGNVHHDHGILGAAAFKDSEYRKMELHKKNGYNAIRTAHNPPSKHLLDACDQLGLLVINESFDMWTMPKKANDYSLFFEDQWAKDMEALILRDRNHPCVIMWSTGNEVNERGGLSDGYEWAMKLAAKVRELDPTRLVTNSVCTFYSALDDDEQKKFYEDSATSSTQAAGFVNFDSAYGERIWGKYTENFCVPLDVVGYNYLPHQFEDAATTYPNRVICSTESTARDMDYYWEGVQRYSYVIGDFTWVSWDHIGEAGLGKSFYVEPEEADELRKRLLISPYPWRLSYSSDFDLCGFERPQLAYRRIIWGSDEIYIASRLPQNYGKTELISGWGWPQCEHAWNWAGYEGKPVEVDIYSAAEEIELILNGQSLGRKPAGKKHRYKAQFTVTYQPGILEAISYTGGKPISADMVLTSGEPFGIRITADKQQLSADGQSLCHAVVEIIDKDGYLVPDAELPATVTVEGAATLAAFGTGRPITEENYTTGTHTSFKGRWLAIIRAGYEPGLSSVTVHVQGLPSKTLEILVT